MQENWKDGWRPLLQHEGAMIGLRAFLALSCVLLLGWWAGWRDELMPALLGVIASALTESDDNWRGRLRAQLMALAAFGLMAAAVWLTWPWPVLLAAVLAVSAFCLTMLGALSERYRAIAFGALILFIYVAMSERTSALPSVDLAVLMLGGALWYGLLSVVWAAFVPRPPVRHRLSQLYALLGESLRLKSLLLEPVRDIDREQRRMALALHNGLVVESLDGTKEAIFSRMGRGRQPAWLQEALKQYLAAQDIHERASSSHEQYELLAEAFFHSDALYRCQRVLAQMGTQAHKLSEAIAHRTRPQHHGVTARAIEDMKAAISHQVSVSKEGRALRALQALGDNLTDLAQVFRSVLSPVDASLDERLLDSHPRSWSEGWQRIKAQCHWDAVLFRHALRLSLSLLAGFAVMMWTQDPHGFWVLLTIVFVSQPQYAATLRKLTQRVVGTILGLVLAWALIKLFPGTLLQSVLMVVAGSLFLSWRKTSYQQATCAMTVLLLLSFHQMGMSQGVIPVRLMDTVLGSAIAVVAAWLILPTWQAYQWPRLASNALRAQAGYLQEIMSQYERGKQDHLGYRTARRRAHQADAALSHAVKTMRKEPARVRLDESVCSRFLMHSHVLLNYLSALGAHRAELGEHALSDSTLAQAEQLRAQLMSLADIIQAKQPFMDFTPADDHEALEVHDANLPKVESLVRAQLRLANKVIPMLMAQAAQFSGVKRLG